MRSDYPWPRVRRLPALCVCLVMSVVCLLAIGAKPAAAVRAEAADAPSLWLSPLEIHFGSVAVGQTATRVVAVRNLGTGPLTLDGGAVDGPFAVDFGACGGALPADATCEMLYSFSPKSAGDFTAASDGNSNAGPWDVALQGRGTAPELQVSPRSLDFGRGPVGGDYPEQVVTVVNIGSVAVGGFSAKHVDAPFVGGLGTCTGTLHPGQSCRMSFDYAPQSAGVFDDDFTLFSDAGDFVIDMQGRTYSGVDGTGQGVTPRAIDFGPVPLGQTVRETVTFRNHDPSIPIVNWEYWWSDENLSLHFGFEEDCGDVLAGLGVCQVTITYRPRQMGDEQVTLNVINSQGIVEIQLWGEGAASEVVADSPAIDLGLPDGSGEQAVHFTNLGRAPAQVLGLQSASGFAVTDSDCDERLAPGASCQATLRFEPGGYGLFEGAIVLQTEAGPSEVRVVGGTATPALAATFEPAQVDRGETATLRLTISNPNEARSLFDVGLDGQLPQGLGLTGDTPRLSDGCGLPTAAADPGVGAFNLDDATILAGQTCVMEVTVIAVSSGSHYYAGAVESDAGPSAPAGATLQVTHKQIQMPFRLFVPASIGRP